MSKKILVADDSVVIQKSIGITFAQEDFDVKFVGNGQDAFDTCSQFNPDIILADVTMPKLGGVDLTKKLKLKAETKNIPVLLLAGARDDMNIQKAKACGATDIVLKPFDSNDLLKMVNQTLDQIQTSTASSSIPDAAPDFGGMDDIKLDVDMPSDDQQDDLSSGFTPFSMDDAPAFNLNEMPEDAKLGDSVSPVEQQNDAFKTEVHYKEGNVPEATLAGDEIEFSMDPTPDIEHEDIASFSVPNPTANLEADRDEKEQFEQDMQSKATALAAPVAPFELSDERIENIITRAFQNVIERIAWEVVPDLAERIIKEEIQRLTGEKKGKQ